MRRRKSAIIFLVLGISLVVLAVALNVGWIFLSLQQIALLIFGILFFALIITGLILNMIFLVREIRRNEQQDAFLNAVTHELKTPITSMRLYLETLQRRTVSEEKRDEFYEIMLGDTDRLMQTVEEVLQASKTRESNRKLHISNINLTNLISDCANLVEVRHKLSKDDISIRSNTDEPIIIEGDADELQTLFRNLLENAVKYSTENPVIKIVIRKRKRDEAEVRIKDQGIGIARQEQKAIFKRFYRVDNPATQLAKGTGLGLFMVDSIVTRHGGNVQAKSLGEGKGATFIVRLPIAAK